MHLKAVRVESLTRVTKSYLLALGTTQISREVELTTCFDKMVTHTVYETKGLTPTIG